MSGMTSWSGNMDQMNSESHLFDLEIVATIGASGAPTLTSGAGWVTIARDSAGDYTITFLPGNVSKLTGFSGWVIPATASGGLDVFLKVDSASTAASIEIVCYARGGTTATEITSGNTLGLNLRLKLA